MTLNDIARTLKKRRALIKYILQEKGFNPGATPLEEYNFSESDFEKIEGFAENYMSAKEIGKLLGANQSNVHRYAKELKITPLVFATQGYYTLDEVARIRSLVEFIKTQHTFTTMRNFATMEKLSLLKLLELAESGKMPFIRGRYAKWVIPNTDITKLRNAGLLNGRHTDFDKIVKYFEKRGA